MQTIKHCKRPCDWLTLPSIKTLLTRHWLASKSQNLTCVDWHLGKPVRESLTVLGYNKPCDWWRETKEGWFYSEETILWEIHGVSRLEYDISSKMDAIDNCNSIAHVNKGGYFVFSPIFSLFWIKKWDAFWRVDPSLEMYASVSWNSPSWPAL